jgi:hypothetical protein
MNNDDNTTTADGQPNTVLNELVAALRRLDGIIAGEMTMSDAEIQDRYGVPHPYAFRAGLYQGELVSARDALARVIEMMEVRNETT